MTKNSHNQYSEKVSGILTGNVKLIGVIRCLGSIVNRLWGVREWYGKDKDIVVTKLLDLTSSKSLNKDDLKLLYNSLGKTLPFDSHPEMLIEWDKIGIELHNSDDLFSIFPQTFKSLENLASFQKHAGYLFLSFRKQYSEYLSNERINEIKSIENSFELWHEFYNCLSFLSRKLSVTTNPMSQVKLLRDWLRFVSQRFAKFNHKKLSFFSQPIIEFFSDFINGDTDEIKINMQSQVSGRHEKNRLNLYIDDMNLFSKSILELISTYSVNLEDISTWLDSLPITSSNWVENNLVAKASLERGLAQACKGKLIRRSFVDMEFED